MHPEWLYPDRVGHFQYHRSVDSERLATLTESPFTAATATNPWHVGNAGRMGYLDGEHVLFSRLYIGGNINSLGGSSDIMSS